MHFVTGGAYNGKRQWVKDHYGFKQRTSVTWLSAYDENTALEQLTQTDSFCTLSVIEGMEDFVRRLLEDETDDKACRSRWRQLFETWNHWEQAHPAHRLVVIGNDISKGLVPLDKSIRRWRDYVGWCYQDVTKICSRVDTIWYGITKTLKMEA
jgi:adenosylcobinamide kinase/adenosylcobinamide-phosphate guanylyltransferase